MAVAPAAGLSAARERMPTARAEPPWQREWVQGRLRVGVRRAPAMSEASASAVLRVEGAWMGPPVGASAQLRYPLLRG